MRRLIVSILAAGVLLLIPGLGRADTDLTQAVNAAYFPRIEDATLHELAHARAAQIAQNFSHDGMTTAEVLAWNVGAADPVAQTVIQWQGSPTHDDLLSDPTFNLIGCGSFTTADGRYFAACLLGSDSPPAQVIVPAPPAEVPLTTPAPMPSAVLPNTAMDR